MINDMIDECDKLLSNDTCKYNRENLIPAYIREKNVWEDMLLPPSVYILFGLLEEFFHDLKIGDSLLV